MIPPTRSQAACCRPIPRVLVTKIALATQAALLVQHAPTVVAEAFISSRLGNSWGPGYGTLRGLDFQAVIDYARLG